MTFQELVENWRGLPGTSEEEIRDALDRLIAIGVFKVVVNDRNEEEFEFTEKEFIDQCLNKTKPKK